MYYLYMAGDGDEGEGQSVVPDMISFRLSHSGNRCCVLRDLVIRSDPPCVYKPYVLA